MTTMLMPMSKRLQYQRDREVSSSLRKIRDRAASCHEVVKRPAPQTSMGSGRIVRAALKRLFRCEFRCEFRGEASVSARGLLVGAGDLAAGQVDAITDVFQSNSDR